MAPLSASKRRISNPRTPKPRPKAPLKPSASANEANSEPPPKRRKYIPGGPGGGGRYVYIDDPVETPASRPSNQNTASRARPAREPAREPSSRNNGASNSKPSNTNHAGPPAPPTTPPASNRPRREKAPTRRYSSAAAAALAVAQGDGYKPREERGWEEFHPDLDIDAKIAVFSSDEVDGIVTNGNGFQAKGTDESGEGTSTVEGTPTGELAKRRPGRPRLNGSILSGIGTPESPKIVPLPGPNPRERLTLPKPSFTLKDPFLPFEQKGAGQQNYVDRTMASVGYQESDIFLRHDRSLIRMTEGAAEEDLDLLPATTTEGDVNAAIGGVGVGRVEYDMDEQDEKWLEVYNAQRRLEQVEPIKPAIFEITMTKIEKEWHALEKRIPKPNPKPPQTQRPRSSSAAAVNGEHTGPGEEQDSKCAICDDGDCENANAIVFCDGCDLAVHQECYGIPYIPEGQWLCRKCQLLGRGSPSCIFCPNTEGAFKQTNASKWSHLLCAIWIPEVSIGNPSLMEPVTEVEKVPRSRWKLNCYICRQKMGACIQCGNKNCYLAFHVTCGRRAQLYLKMKLTPGTPAVMDSQGLKAFCDKHVPQDWREEHNTDAATADAMEFYRTAMQGRRWGDSQAAALALGPYSQDGNEQHEDENRGITPRITLTMGGSNKRKRPTGSPKTVWKLPSGAPVIPQVILNSIVASLQRFTVRQRKQYAEDACKYWTLKREARRGAALLKRLQLQLETFSSMEMTRRNFAGMGVAGNVRLQRRIEFADKLYVDVDKVRMLCDEVKKREREKLKDAETLKNIVDLVYFPIPPQLWPIFDKAIALDGKAVFRLGFLAIRSKLVERAYTSVSEFSRDLAHVFTAEIGVESVGDTAELQMQISGRAPELSVEQREKRTIAKRIIKAIQPFLEDALKKESELNGKPFEKELKDLDLILESSVLSRRASILELPEPEIIQQDQEEQAAMPDGDEMGLDSERLPDGEVAENAEKAAEPASDENADASGAIVVADKEDVQMDEQPEASAEQQVNGENAFENHDIQESGSVSAQAPLENGMEAEGGAKETISSTNLPKLSDDQELPQWALGGIQWYMQPFDPVGTTVHEERWTGREVLRGMSEELSEIDEEELRDLVGDEEAVAAALEQGDGKVGLAAIGQVADGIAPKPRPQKPKKRPKRFW